MKALDEVGGRSASSSSASAPRSIPAELHAIGRQGAVLSKNPAEVKAAFDKIAEQVEALHEVAFYLFSYCSPARAGRHDVKIEADVKGRGKGGLEYHSRPTAFSPTAIRTRSRRSTSTVRSSTPKSRRSAA
jgi:hypothetical protein